MKLTISREDLLRPLQITSSVVERRHTLPVLSNVLLSLRNGSLNLTGTDLEVEINARIPVEDGEEGEITLPARKFLDICKALPEGARIEMTVDEGKALIRSGRSRFSLSTLPATEFPNIEPISSPLEISLAQKDLRNLIDRTQFSMAQQDVRYFLNGLMLEFAPDHLRAVATDGHRLAKCDAPMSLPVEETRQIIVPRKGVAELARLLDDSDTQVRISLGENHIAVDLPDITFTSKLIDGKFPDYQQVIPQNPDKILTCPRQDLHNSFTRASVLSNEKYRGMRLQLDGSQLRATVHNPEQEEAVEEMEVRYEGEPFEIGFNVSYFIDALAAIDSDEVTVKFTDANHSCLVEGADQSACQYVIMPMRL